MLTLETSFSIVAVHGLGGHAIKTWTSRNGKQWLKDFLPKDTPDARIMTFGYDARVLDSRSVIGMMENANNLLTNLRFRRSSLEVRQFPMRTWASCLTYYKE
jgi:hypothetical protein